MNPLNPLNPLMHPAYQDWSRLPDDLRSQVSDLLQTRAECPESEIDAIDRAIVAKSFWYLLRPDEIASRTLLHHGWQSPLTIEQATTVLAALAEAGFPIVGNGAPDYPHRWEWCEPGHLPVRGEERNRVIWAAARHWAAAASQHLTYVSLGDSRGYCPRAVQYDQPGSMNPSQQAALTLGPWADRDDECGSHDYMRRHTQCLILVQGVSSSLARCGVAS